MNLGGCIAGQAILLVAALCIILLRFYSRVFLEKRRPILADYLVLAGWLCALSWSICQMNAIVVLMHNPLSDDGLVTSVEYLKSAFASVVFFDFALMFPKTSITMFYWWLIPPSSRGLRKMLIFCTVFVACAFVATFLSDMLFCVPITDNWSLENQYKSIWFSYNNTAVNWALNISTDAVLFLLPIFIFRKLKLRKAQRWSLVGVFSLGLITMAVSISRFTAPPSSSDFFGMVGAVWCTAELCTGIIVVSLPSLKNMIIGAVEKLGSTFSSQKTQSSIYVREISGGSTAKDSKNSNVAKSRRFTGKFEAGLLATVNPHDTAVDMDIEALPQADKGASDAMIVITDEKPSTLTDIKIG